MPQDKQSAHIHYLSIILNIPKHVLWTFVTYCDISWRANYISVKSSALSFILPVRMICK